MLHVTTFHTFPDLSVSLEMKLLRVNVPLCYGSNLLSYKSLSSCQCLLKVQRYARLPPTHLLFPSSGSPHLYTARYYPYKVNQSNHPTGVTNSTAHAAHGENLAKTARKDIWNTLFVIRFARFSVFFRFRPIFLQPRCTVNNGSAFLLFYSKE